MLNLLSTPLDLLYINREDVPDMTGRRDIEELLAGLTGESYMPAKSVIESQVTANHSLILDYLNFIYHFVDFNWQVIDIGFTDTRQLNEIILVIKRILESIVNSKKNHESWYCQIIYLSKKTSRNNEVRLHLRKIAKRCLQVVSLFSRVRIRLIVMAYLRHFRDMHDSIKKFRCRLSTLQSMLSMFDLNSEEHEEEQGLDDLFRGNFGNLFNRVKSKTEKFNQVAPESKELTQANQGLKEQIEKLKTYKYPFVKLLVQTYHELVATSLNCDAIVMADFVAINKDIQALIFNILDDYYMQQKLFADYIEKILLFVGTEEIAILSDFEGDSKASAHQVVSVNRLREKIDQILLDDASSQNQLQNITSSDSKQRRILEFTNIINKILSKFTNRIGNPRQFTKTQDLLRTLGFHTALMEVLSIGYDPKYHKMMITKTIRLLEYFATRNKLNAASLLVNVDSLLNLVNHGIQSSKVVSMAYDQVAGKRCKAKAIKNVFERIYQLTDRADPFSQASRDTPEPEPLRVKVVEYMRIIRRLMVDGRKLDSNTQLVFVECLIFCFQMSKNLLPSQVEYFVTPDVKDELNNRSKSLADGGLLHLLVEFYSLINLSIENNTHACTVITSLIDQTSIKSVIMNEEYHPLIRVRLLRTYVRAYLFHNRGQDKSKLAAKTVDVLAFICDQILAKFQCSLPFLADFAKLSTPKREYCEFMEELVLKNNFFGFDYLSDKNVSANKRKLIHFVDKPADFGDLFWIMMADGDVYSMSYDGILIILQDIFAFSIGIDIHQQQTMKEVLAEIKNYLQNMLFAAILTADKYFEAQLKGFIFILTATYNAVPSDGQPVVLPDHDLKFKLADMEEIPEFYLDEKCLADASVRLTILEKQRENLVEEFARKNLTPDVLSTYIGSCFTNYLVENNVQIYDIHTLLPSSKYFDVCVTMRSMLGSQGVTFRQSMMFIEEIVYRLEERIENKDVVLSKVTKKITELVQTSKPLGRKAALREEKKRKMQADFSYVNEKEKESKDIAKTYIGLGRGEADEFGLNSEAIFIECARMKSFAREAIKLVGRKPYKSFVETLLKLSEEKKIQSKVSKIAAFFSLKFATSTNESVILQRLKLCNQVCQSLVDLGSVNELEKFLYLLEEAGLDILVYSRLGKNRSLHLEIESFVFLMFFLRQHHSSFNKLAHYFLDQGAELYIIAKQIFCKSTLLTLNAIVHEEMPNFHSIQLVSKYLDFVIALYDIIIEKELSEDLLKNCDQFSFHLYRRLGEFLVALNTFFAKEGSHLYVGRVDPDLNREA